jgi:RND family efflux transporter MFP subunit
MLMIKSRVLQLRSWLGRALLAAAFAALVLLLLLWLAGAFSPKVQSTGTSPPSPVVSAPPTVPVRTLRLPVTETAVGSIEAVHQTSISSRLAARVVEVNIRAGQPITRGQVLLRLDDADLRARLRQAQAATDQAAAVRANADSEFKRIAGMYQNQAASRNEYDNAQTALKTADAQLVRAHQAVREAESLLEYATVTSPLDGIVVDKKVDVGDTAMPGQVLATAYDPRAMQLVASVRESLAHRLKVGQEIGVRVDVLDKTCGGQISEIVPETRSASRSFQVKVTGPCPPGIYSGMFGRIIIPLDEEQVLVVPAAAVRNVGQLELVDVMDPNGLPRRRAVRTGRRIGDDREVLSGLRAGERVALSALPSAPLGNGD